MFLTQGGYGAIVRSWVDSCREGAGQPAILRKLIRIENSLMAKLLFSGRK
ncbi:MAG: hypothetical protein R3D56_05035 [Paracoccaceae bacterium]